MQIAEIHKGGLMVLRDNVPGTIVFHGTESIVNVFARKTLVYDKGKMIVFLSILVGKENLDLKMHLLDNIIELKSIAYAYCDKIESLNELCELFNIALNEDSTESKLMAYREIAKSIENASISIPKKPTGIRRIQLEICDYFGISLYQMLNGKRNEYVLPKHIAIWICEKLGYKKETISNNFGGFYVYGIKKVCDNIEKKLTVQGNSYIVALLERMRGLGQ